MRLLPLLETSSIQKYKSILAINDFTSHNKYILGHNLKHAFIFFVKGFGGKNIRMLNRSLLTIKQHTAARYY